MAVVTRVWSSLAIVPFLFVSTVGGARAACSSEPFSANLGSQSSFMSIAALSPMDAWAVGSMQAGAGTLPVAERWDGATWSFAPVASQSPGALTSVTTLGPDDAWAVGYDDSGALIERWNGATWNRLAAPPGADSLAGVGAGSPADVWAVGSAHAIDTSPAALHWNGVRWSNAPTARVRAGSASLLGVAVAGAADVWAVGSSIGSGLTEHWNGTSWSVVTSPVLTDGSLQAVAANASEAWAVGQQVRDGRYEPVVEHWNGRAWSVVPTSAPVGAGAVLYGVALDATGAWAVGASVRPGGDVTAADAPLLMRYSAGGWTMADSRGSGDLFAVATVPGRSTAWVVGQNLNAVASAGACLALEPPPR
jgi:hypothetical protein